MDELAEKIKALLENPNVELWFPELTSDLAAWAWSNLYRDVGLMPYSYSTERVLSRSISTPREVITYLKTCPSACETAKAIAIEALSPESAIRYQKQGVNFYPADDILHSTILSCLEDALAIMNEVPSLMRTVAALVHSLHIIKPEDTDYDVSFSEPHLAFSIFVSVPEKRVVNDCLRVAEAIVHEAMHLQLTLIDRVTPLTNSTADRYYSPWRGEYRSVLGVLHALYAFQVIAYLFQQLRSIRKWPTEIADYMDYRRAAIGKQVAEIESFACCTELTQCGGFLTKRLILTEDSLPILDLGHSDLRFH